MSSSEFLVTATLEKRENGLGTRPTAVRLIPGQAGSISSQYGAKTNSKAKKKVYNRDNNSAKQTA